MGHFGRKPIARGWLLFVMPALLLAYFGQGALILRLPETAANPFFLMVPPGALTWALVVLASIATVIASQALISGSFSLTRQAIQLGLFPRVTIRHTAADEEGQIYIPEVNALLAAACIVLVLLFRESSKLAAAYGIAVTCTMTITSLVFAVVVVRVWGWPRWRALALLALFLSFDIPFVVANAIKIADGGWVPVLIGAGLVLTMLVWHQGRRLVARSYLSRYPRFDDAWSVLSRRIVTRTPGVAVFMASADEGVPPFLVHHVERTRALQQKVLLLTVVTRDVPRVELKDRLVLSELAHGFWRVHVCYGFFEQPDIPRALRLAVARRDLDIDLAEVTYYLARERILGNPGGDMNWVLERFFGFLSRNAVHADGHFRIPHGQVIEVGVQIDL